MSISAGAVPRACALLLLAGPGALPAMAAPVLSGAVIRLTHPGARTAAAYLSISNPDKAPLQLEAVAIPAASRTLLHGTTMAEGMLQMRSLAGITIPPGGTVTLAPGGQHIMLIGVRGPLAFGSRVAGSLSFRGQAPVKLQFKVEPVTMAAPAPH